MTIVHLFVILAALAVSLGIAIVMMSRLPATVDEVWFLRVATRVHASERLYADVFYEAGPLAIWMVSWCAPTARRLRYMSAAVYALTVGLLVAMLGMIGCSPIAMVGASVAMVGLTGPVWPTDNFYGLLSRLGLAISAFGLASAPHAPDFWGGLAALGMAIALLSKYNLGAIGILVVVAPIVLIHGPVAATTFVFSVALFVLLAAVAMWRQGILRAFFVRAVQNKRTYLRTARLTIWEGLRQIRTVASTVPAVAPAIHVAHLAFAIIGLALPCAIVAGFLLIKSEQGASQVIAVLLLGCSALAALWPRADWEHVGPALPLVFAALPAAIVLIWPEGELFVSAILTLGGLFGLVAAYRIWSLPEVSIHQPARYPWVERRAHGFDTPLLAGIPVGCYVTGSRQQAGDQLRSITGGEVFMLRSDAAVWYTGLGLTNPTAFDFPIAPTFGANGQSEIIEALRSGAIRWCCFEPFQAGLLTPVELESFVPNGMDLVAETALGGLFRSRK